ncbi:MAG: TerC family protein [Pseudomonadota bacterium]
MWETVLDYGAIIIADIVLSGDNALIIGMAAAGLSPELRKKAIIFGMVIAALLRVVFALVATKLLAVPGLLFVGGILLCWVCWGLYREIRNHGEEDALHAIEEAEDLEKGYTGKPRRTLGQALWTITLADVSMSIDNVLAVAAIADGNTKTLVFGLGLAILLMAFAATIIMKLLTKYPWISWLGLIVLIYVSAEMLYRGVLDESIGILAHLRNAGFLG